MLVLRGRPRGRRHERHGRFRRRARRARRVFGYAISSTTPAIRTPARRRVVGRNQSAFLSGAKHQHSVEAGASSLLDLRVGGWAGAMAKGQRGHALRQSRGPIPAPSAWAWHPTRKITRENAPALCGADAFALWAGDLNGCQVAQKARSDRVPVGDVGVERPCPSQPCPGAASVLSTERMAPVGRRIPLGRTTN